MRARRAAENAVVPSDRIFTGEDYRGPTTKSDRQPECLLREGHRVHFVATSTSSTEEPVVRELHCASHYCDYHEPLMNVNETVSVNTSGGNLTRGDTYEGHSSIYVGEATLIADYKKEECTALRLTDIDIEAYTEKFSVPAPTDD